MDQTLDILKVHPRVLRDLRARDLSEREITEMTPEQAFSEFCKYNGFSGKWGGTLPAILDSLRASCIAPRIDDVVADPSVSDWLKRTLKSALQRDILDAANDARLLSKLLDARLQEALRMNGN